MKKLLVLSLCVVHSFIIVAQKKLVVTVKAGSNIMDVLPSSEIFSYPSFTPATVFFRNGATADARLNYNRVVDEMHFIDPTGDTLAIDSEKQLNYIVINTDSFYYDQGYVRLLSSGGLLKLGIRQRWVTVDTRQFAAYNSNNNSERLFSFATLRQGGRLYDLTVNQDMTLETTESYYFGNSFNHFLFASKASLLSLLPKQQGAIKKYLKENKVRFNNLDDLNKLLQFINSSQIY